MNFVGLAPCLSFRSLAHVSVLLFSLWATGAPARAEGSFQFGLRQPLTEWGYTAGNIPRGDRPVFVDVLNSGETINVSLCGTVDSDTLRVEFYDSLGALVASQNLAGSNVTCNNPMTSPLVNPLRYTPPSTGAFSVRVFNTTSGRYQLCAA